MTPSEWFVAIAGLVFLTLQAMVVFPLIRALRRLRPVEAGVTHFGDVLSLLTETTESGFRAVTLEVERLGTRMPRPAGVRTTSARVASAARKGKTVRDIASTEQISEGEVRLRLHLAEQAKVDLPQNVNRRAPKAVEPRAREMSRARVDALAVASMSEPAVAHDAAPKAAARARVRRVRPSIETKEKDRVAVPAASRKSTKAGSKANGSVRP